jgi:hypothetical protein
MQWREESKQLASGGAERSKQRPAAGTAHRSSVPADGLFQGFCGRSLDEVVLSIVMACAAFSISRSVS